MTGMKWITRVPLSIKEAPSKILEIAESEWHTSGLPGYKIAERTSEYSKIQQRWLIVESEVRKTASIKQINKQVKKQLENVKVALRKLYRQEFACQADAETAINQLSYSWKYHKITEIKCREKAIKKSKETAKSATKPETRG